MDDGSSSGEVDEGHRAVAVDEVIREEDPAGMDAAAEGASHWESRRGDVARGADFKVAAPWGCGMEHRRCREVELRRRCDAMRVQPRWWRRVGLGFIREVGEDAAVPVEQVKAALWGWSSRERRGDRRSSSLEVEDGAAEPAGRRDG